MMQCKISGKYPVVTVPVARNATTHDVKAKLESAVGVKVARQTLRLSSGGEELEDDRSIESYGFVGDAELHLDVEPLAGDPEFAITIRSLGSEATVKVRETSTVRELKGKIEELWGMHRSKLVLSHMSTRMTDFDRDTNDDSLLSDYYISDFSVVDVGVKG
ncbi:hypothetical protein Tsubulata_046209 [Turnera subulata]|uniref:Ubiquitin-like domain-containing protein n=1 Tax=Turnera subulata TaxID=218843 RepID=A0A9Q0G258_9ROSI|nr:hypothetical protein Tsubulata_046209 [Turnera subulata]